jgi:preprotein translocase SecE subunit
VQAPHGASRNSLTAVELLVARNRKRRSDRRPTRPSDGGSTPPGVATARPGRRDETPDPIEHATPDVELAEAQLALGRPELVEQDEALADIEPAEDLSDGELPAPDADALDDDDDLDVGAGGFGGDRGRSAQRPGGGGSGSGRRGGELTPGGAPTPAPRGGSRLIHFLQGSWRELQRVQWPDRRQVMQATGVVIGFVIVAGVFLGVADLIAGRVVNLIIK